MLFTMSIEGSELFDYLAATILSGTTRRVDDRNDVFHEANYRYLADLDHPGGFTLQVEADAVFLTGCTLEGVDELGWFAERIEADGLIGEAVGHLREIEDEYLWEALYQLGLETDEITTLLLRHGDDVFGHVDRATDKYIFPEFYHMVETLFPLVRA